ncbi:MAG TPA: hypothetical protein VFS11_03750 [Gemmatimonadales bacterium]|nr:hypothetical protein [Gemmatimonadales bacterium]
MLAVLSGLMTGAIGSLVVLQWLEPSSVRLFVPEVLPVMALAAIFWGLVTALLWVAGRRSRRSPGGGGPGGGEPLPLPRRSSAPMQRAA